MHSYKPSQIFVLLMITNTLSSCPYLGDGRLLQGISDNQERKITCIQNTFESPARSEQKKETSSSSRTSSKTSSSQTTSAVLGKPSTSTASSNSVACFNSDTVKLDNRPFPPNHT